MITLNRDISKNLNEIKEGRNYSFLLRIFLQIIIFAVLLFMIVVGSASIAYRSKVYVLENESQQIDYVIIYGAGYSSDINESLLLTKDRVDAAVELYKSGKVQKIHVSANDNFLNFNELTFIKNELQKNKIPDFLITYDDQSENILQMCKHAKKDFKINKAIITLQDYQRDTVLYACNSMGIDSYFYSAERSIYGNLRSVIFQQGFTLLEIIINIYIGKA